MKDKVTVTDRFHVGEDVGPSKSRVSEKNNQEANGSFRIMNKTYFFYRPQTKLRDCSHATIYWPPTIHYRGVSLGSVLVLTWELGVKYMSESCLVPCSSFVQPGGCQGSHFSCDWQNSHVPFGVGYGFQGILLMFCFFNWRGTSIVNNTAQFIDISEKYKAGSTEIPYWNAFSSFKCVNCSRCNHLLAPSSTLPSLCQNSLGFSSG